MCSDYTLQIARARIDAYSNMDEVMRQHHEIMECCDRCEKFLQSGIEAYEWLQKAENTIQRAAREGFSVSDEVPAAIDHLYRTWLVPCSHAEELVSQQQQLGYIPANLDEFRAACEQVKKRIQMIDAYDAIDDAFGGKTFDAAFWIDAMGSQPS